VEKLWDINEESRREPKMRKIGLAYFLLGIVVGVVGYGMWISPELDWGSFKQALVDLAQHFEAELVRVLKDPFALLGVLVVFAGVILIYEGIKRMIFGKTAGGKNP